MLTDFLDRVVLVIGVSNNLYQSSNVKPSCRRQKLMTTSPLRSPISSHLALSSPPIRDCCLWHKPSYSVYTENISTTRFIIIRRFFSPSTNWSRSSIIFNSADCFTDSPDGDAYESSPSDSSMKMCDVETAHPIEETEMKLQQICIDGSQNAWCRYLLHVGQIIGLDTWHTETV